MMDFGKIELKENDLNFLEVLEYFKSQSNILQVSIEKSIDIDLVKSYLPSKVSLRPNIYALYIKKDLQDWKIMYVGQRKYNGVLERLRQHLIKKHELTGSKLDNIKEALENNFDVGIKLFSVRPDTMRLYYEEELISNLNLEWNQQKHQIKNQQSKI